MPDQSVTDYAPPVLNEDTYPPEPDDFDGVDDLAAVSEEGGQLPCVPEGEQPPETGGKKAPIKPDDVGSRRYDKIRAELKKLFSKLNEELFNGEIGAPVINVQGGKRGPKQTCWCSEQQVWRNTEEDLPQYYEICYSAEYISRPIEEIAADMLHQMVHLWNTQHGIKDSCRSGTYHNGHFKKSAENHGLGCMPGENKKDGYALICLPAPVLDLVSATVDIEAFSITREIIKPPKKAKKEKKPTPLDDFKQRLSDVMKLHFAEEADAAPLDIAKLATELSAEIIASEREMSASSDGEPFDGMVDEPAPVSESATSLPTPNIRPDNKTMNLAENEQDLRLLLATQFGMTAYVCPSCEATVFAPAGEDIRITCSKCGVDMLKTN